MKAGILIEIEKVQLNFMKFRYSNNKTINTTEDFVSEGYEADRTLEIANEPIHRSKFWSNCPQYKQSLRKLKAQSLIRTAVI